VLLLRGHRLLFIGGGVGVGRAGQGVGGRGDRRVLATFVMLLGVLAWMARGVG
jgi:hypothetical protein